MAKHKTSITISDEASDKADAMIDRNYRSRSAVIEHLIHTTPCLHDTLAKLNLEAIHYRDTGIGVQFLNAALIEAAKALQAFDTAAPALVRAAREEGEK